MKTSTRRCNVRWLLPALTAIQSQRKVGKRKIYLESSNTGAVRFIRLLILGMRALSKECIASPGTGGALHSNAPGAEMLGTAGEKNAERPFDTDADDPVEPSGPTRPNRQKSLLLLLEFSCIVAKLNKSIFKRGGLSNGMQEIQDSNWNVNNMCHDSHLQYSLRTLWLLRSQRTDCRLVQSARSWKQGS